MQNFTARLGVVLEEADESEGGTLLQGLPHGAGHSSGCSEPQPDYVGPVPEDALQRRGDE